MKSSVILFVLPLLFIASPSFAAISGSVRAPSGDVSPDFAGGPFVGYESVNLTAKGTLDWFEAGTDATTPNPGFVSTAATNYKLTGTAIGPLTISTPGIGISGDNGGTIFKTWTDGTPRAASSTNGNEVLTDGSFAFDVASAASTSHLDVFTSITGSATGLFTAILKDSSNNALGTYSQSVAAASATNIFGVDFSGGDHLSVLYSVSSGSGKVGLSAATLSAVPEPGSLMVISLAALGMAARRRHQ